MAIINKDPISGAYIVAPSDTLSKIASTQGRTLEELLATNPQFQNNPSLIHPGDIVLPKGGLPQGMFGENAPVGTPGAFNYATPQAAAQAKQAAAPASQPSLSNAYAGQTSGGQVPTALSNSNPTTSFTEALIKMLKDAQAADSAGQASLMKQSQGITGLGLNDANMNFRNKKLAPSAGTSLGMSAQNQFDPLQLSIANQQKLATQNLGSFTDLIKQTQDAYDKEQDRLLEEKENALDRIEKAKDRAASNSGGGAGSIKLTPTDRQGLLGAGFLSGEIPQIEADVNKYGIKAVLEGITDPIQKAAIQKAYGAVAGGGEQFLNKIYLRSLYTPSALEQAAADAGFGDMGEGFFNLKDVDVEAYLDYLVTLVDQYRRAGYTDKEILNLMK